MPLCVLPENPDTLEAKGQMRLVTDFGPREVPKRREPKPDKGTDGLPLFEQPDEEYQQEELARSSGA